MSLRSIFRGMLGRLRRRTWGLRFDLDGKRVDSGVQDFANEIYNSLSSDAPIELSEPIRFTRRFAGPVFQISGSEAAIAYVGADGSTSGSMPATMRVRVVAIGDDTLSVRDSADGVPFLALKPYELRRSSFDRKSLGPVTYTYSGPQTRSASGTVEQITPPYAIGDELVVVSVRNGYAINGPDGQPLLFTDSNVGAKTWFAEGSSSNPAEKLRWQICDPANYEAALPTLPITGATNTTPIVVTCVNHRLRSGQHCTISGVLGNTAANGTFEVDAHTIRILNATNATPIVITTEAKHRFAIGDEVRIEHVAGNTAANSTNADPSWTVSASTSNTITLSGSVGNSTYDGNGFVSWADKFALRQMDNTQRVVTGATNASPIVVTATAHGFGSGDRVIVLGVVGNTAANNTSTIDTWVIANATANTFELVGSTGNGAYTSGGTAELAFGNHVADAAGNGAYTSGGAMIRPGRLTLVGCTGATDTIKRNAAEDLGWIVGLPLRLRTTSPTATVYGLIAAIPGGEGYPRTIPLMPNNQDNELTWAGPPLTGTLSSVEVGTPEMVIQRVLPAHKHPYFGSIGEVPISQIVQGTTQGLVDKWRPSIGGATLFGDFNDENLRWMRGNAYMVAFSVTAMVAPEIYEPHGDFSNGPNVISPDASRPYNSSEQHTDGYSGRGSLVTLGSGFWVNGHPQTGLRGRIFHRLDTAGAIAETSAVREGGYGPELLIGEVVDATNDNPIVITTADEHALTTGCKVTIVGVTGNTAANVVANAITKIDDHRFSLDGVDGLASGVYGGIISDKTITNVSGYKAVKSTTAATPIVVTCIGHGFATGDKVVIENVPGTTNPEGRQVITVISADAFSLNGSSSASAGTAGGTVYKTPLTITCPAHGLTTGDFVVLSGIRGNTYANGFWKVTVLTVDTFTIADFNGNAVSTTNTSGPRANGTYAGGGICRQGGGFVKNGLTSGQLVLESMTMSDPAPAHVNCYLENRAQSPFVNVNIGGQIVGTNDGHRGIRTGRLDNVTVYNPPAEINVLSYDLVFTSRFELSCMGIGNCPGIADSDDESLLGAQFLSTILVFVLE
jgi:hypothetical protein